MGINWLMFRGEDMFDTESSDFSVFVLTMLHGLDQMYESFINSEIKDNYDMKMRTNLNQKMRLIKTAIKMSRTSKSPVPHQNKAAKRFRNLQIALRMRSSQKNLLAASDTV